MPELQERFRAAWSQALVGLNAAEAEAEKAIAKIADAAGFTPEDVRRQAREFGERLQLQRREIERSLDEAVKKATSRFKLPSRDEVEELRKRVENIAARLEALTNARHPTPPGHEGPSA